MGIHFSHDTPAKSELLKNNSTLDLPEKSQHQKSRDSLSKMLSQKTWEEEHIDGISCRVFERYVMLIPDLATRLFSHMLKASNANTTDIISISAFSEQADYIISIIPDRHLTPFYVSAFSDGVEFITTGNFRDFLLVAYSIAMNHYVEGPQFCRYILHTVQGVICAAFHKKKAVCIGYLSNWLDEHCPRLIPFVHRYVTHKLTTAHFRIIEGSNQDERSGLELSTPVLEKPFTGFDGIPSKPLLPISLVWLLSMTLPKLYTRPSQPSSPSIAKPASAKNLLARVMDFSCPSHWTLLYSSDQHGLGANRFVYHISNYRGPNLTFFQCEQGFDFCIGVPEEWKESHQYWGSEDSIILQIMPSYHILHRGQKSVYMNLSIRGYPMGIRTGSDPRNPVLDVDSAFNILKYCGVPYKLESVEVWGCGNPQSRELQLDIRKWEGREVEKARKVKLTTNDWSDHPDRYLLELAGRPSYSSNS